MSQKRRISLLIAAALSLGIWAIAAAQGHGWELLWLPAVVTGAAWPNNVRLGACRRRLRRDRSVPGLPPDDL